MGTPDFAVPPLDRLISDGYNVCGVFSQPDRPSGRGYKLAAPPVKELAMKHDIPVYQPEKLRDGSALKILEGLAPDIIVVVAYGRILPKEILELPRLGCINVHASLLPQLRGAAPIQWSVINGLEETGVTTMYMAEGLDTGDIIQVKKTPIGGDETGGELFDRLSVLGAQCLGETIPQLIDGTATRTVQDEALATWAPMITRETGIIDFTRSPQEIHDLVRGLAPRPGAHTTYDGKRLRIHKTAPLPDCKTTAEAGTVIDSTQMIVACGSGAVQLITVQLEGKKAISATDFARGQRIENGIKFI